VRLVVADEGVEDVGAASGQADGAGIGRLPWSR
jgi:hypothetical protein